MAKCFVTYGKGVGNGTDNGFWYESIHCANTITFQYETSNPYTGNTPWMRLVVDGVPSPTEGYFPGTEQLLEVTEYPLADQYSPDPRAGRVGNCDSCLSAVEKYDCINGKCELSTKYNTVGFYKSLADCEAVCGNGACVSGKQCLDPVNYCPPGKVCIEDVEHSKIQKLIQQIKSKSC